MITIWLYGHALEKPQPRGDMKFTIYNFMTTLAHHYHVLGLTDLCSVEEYSIRTCI